MEATAISRAKCLAWKSLAGILLMVFAGCAEPVHVAWNETQSVIEPEDAPPQAGLEVYSERYVFWDADVPRTHRRPVQVYSVDGQLVASAPDQDGDGPIHFVLTPGHYIVTSESHLQSRRVQVDVQDGRKTVVAESQLDHAPLLASSQSERSTSMVAHSAVAGVKR
jgi:hypothetical protein